MLRSEQPWCEVRRRRRGQAMTALPDETAMWARLRRGWWRRRGARDRDADEAAESSGRAAAEAPSHRVVKLSGRCHVEVGGSVAAGCCDHQPIKALWMPWQGFRRTKLEASGASGCHLVALSTGDILHWLIVCYWSWLFLTKVARWSVYTLCKFMVCSMLNCIYWFFDVYNLEWKWKVCPWPSCS
jgi:hypothetical protein